MITLDLPPKIPLVRPAIIRPAEHKLLRPHYLPATKEQKRAAIQELVASGQLTEAQARHALIFFCVPMFATGGTSFEVLFYDTFGNADNLSNYGWSGTPPSPLGDNFTSIVLGAVGMTTNRTVNNCYSWDSDPALSQLDTAVTGTNNRTFCYGGPVTPDGVAAAIEIYLSGGCARAHAALFYARGPAAPSLNGDSNSSGSDTSKSVFVNVAAGGYVVAFAVGSSATPTWTGVTKIEDTGDVESGQYGVAAMAGPLSANASYEVNCNTCRNLSAVAINPG